MTNEAQVLFLEGLGVPKSMVARLAVSMDLDLELVWDADAADKDQVQVLVTVKKEVGADLLKAFPNVETVAVAFTGFDAVDAEYCKAHGIAVYNVPAYATKSVSELTVGLAIGLLRQIPRAHGILQEKKWELEPGIELAGKTVGILGTGTIGINTAHLFKAFGCTLLGWSRTQKDEFTELGGTYVAHKRELLESSDIVTVNVPLNEKTRDLIGAEELKMMKKSAFLINTARGPIVNQEDLVVALEKGELAGAGIDVYDQEPIAADNPLLALDNVILTPHIAYKTEEALSRRARTTLKNIKNGQQGDTTNRVI